MKFAFVIALTVVTTLCCFLWGLFGNDPTLLSARRVLQSLRGLNRSNNKWAILSSVFGTQMEYTFGGEETFEYAHPDPITATGDGYRVRCTNYNTEVHEGLFSHPRKKISFAIKIVFLTFLSIFVFYLFYIYAGIGMPFYVDQPSDTICYAGNSFALPNTVTQEAFNIDFLVIAPLKIHYNVYDLVDSLAASTSTAPTTATPQVITTTSTTAAAKGSITSTPSISVDDEHTPHPPSVRSAFLSSLV